MDVIAAAIPEPSPPPATGLLPLAAPPNAVPPVAAPTAPSMAQPAVPAPGPAAKDESKGGAKGGGDVTRVRREAIGIHLAFANLHPLIRRTRHLSLNAILASARLEEDGRPFGIVAQELNTVGGDLRRLIDEIERMFGQLVHSIARWGKSELNLGYLERSRANLQRGAVQPNAVQPNAVRPVAGPGHAARPAREPAGDRQGRTLALLQQHMRAMRATVLTEIERIDLLAGKLSSRIDRINWVAVRQCHYTSISAQIEAAQVHDDRTGLAAVAGDIRALANDIAVAEQQAKERAERLRELLKTQLPLLKKQVRHA